MKFWKYVAIGNDFPLIELEEGQDLPALALALCDRRFGVGGDGLMGARMEGDRLLVRMFNPDGTEDFCGNGLRCAALHARRMGWVGSSFTASHGGIEIPVLLDGELICTTLGSISYDPAAVPVVSRIVDDAVPGFEVLGSSSATTTGSTHLIVHRAPVSEEEFFGVSPLVEVAPVFPLRTSVIWTSVEEPGVLRIRIWERGVGETLGCGTGSAAAAADYRRRSGFDGPVRVINRGGEVVISAPSWDGPLTIGGRAKFVFEGDYQNSPHPLPPPQRSVR